MWIIWKTAKGENFVSPVYEGEIISVIVKTVRIF